MNIIGFQGYMGFYLFIYLFLYFIYLYFIELFLRSVLVNMRNNYG
jgi:hypothetical protein